MVCLGVYSDGVATYCGAVGSVDVLAWGGGTRTWGAKSSPRPPQKSCFVAILFFP